MKKLTITALVILAVSTASAQSIPDAAVTLDHPLYDTKLSIEKQIQELAPNETARARAQLEQAENRLSETKTLVEKNKTRLANQTAKNYSQEMQELQEFGDRISDLAQKREIDALVANATMIHTEVLSKVYEKVPEQAKAGIQKALNRSVTGYQKAVQALNRTGGIPEGIKNQDVKSMVPGSVRDKVGIPSFGGFKIRGSSGEKGSSKAGSESDLGGPDQGEAGSNGGSSSGSNPTGYP